MNVIPSSSLPFLLDRVRARLAARSAQPGRVVIVGAGLAGLCAANRLINLGHHVSLLEADAVPGGRTKTLRGAFKNGLFADAGGFRFRDDHHFVKSYAKKLKLDIAPFYPKSGGSVAYFGGVRIVRNPGQAVMAKQFPIAFTPVQQWMFAQENNFRSGSSRPELTRFPTHWHGDSAMS